MKGNRFINSLDHYDAFTFLIVGIIAFMTSLSFIVLNLYFKEARKFPSILLTMISVGELLISIHWIMTGFYSQFIWRVHHIDPKGLFCRTSALLISIGTIIQYLYHMSFLISIIVMFRNALSKLKFKKLYIIIPFLLTIGATTSYILSGGLGKDFFGVCTLEDTNLGNMVFTFIYLFIYICIVLVTLYILKRFKSRSDRELMLKNSNEFYYFYKNYSIYMMVYYFVSTSNHIISFLFKNYFISHDNYCGDLCMRLFFMSRLLNNFKLFLPVISFMLRISDPYLRNILKEYSRKRKKSYKRNLFDESLSMVIQETSTYLFNKSSFTVDRKDIEIIRTLNRIKMNCTKTILICLKAYYQAIFRSIAASMENMDDVFVGNLVYDVSQLLDIHSDLSKRQSSKQSLDTPSKREFSLKSKKSLEDLPWKGHRRDSSLDLRIFPEYLNGTVNIFFGKEFAKIIIQRNYLVDQIFKSFDQTRNRKNINKTGTIKGGSSGNGGASGEFFFVTYDKKFIIKTISQEEEAILLSIIGKYTDHISWNPGSIISRLVGYFVFDLDILDKKIRVIVMENIFKIHGPCIKRRYDLKGSTYQRKIMRLSDLNKLKVNMNIRTKWVHPRTLKDIDFNRIEKKIVLSPEKRRQILGVIERDVRFLESVGVIDYSLIVAVLYLDDLRQEKFQSELAGVQKQINALMEKGIFISDENFEYGYIIGIIDFFQMFTLSKWIEKYYKIFINMRFDLNTSSQPAKVYADRFLSYMERIFSDNKPSINLSLNSYDDL